MTNVVYKIATREQWDEALKDGVFKGAPVDLADGYIHFSTASQVEGTVAKHFKGQKGLLLITVDAKQFGETMKWEPSRGGDLFPHLYADLETDKVQSVVSLEDLQDGSHKFPEHY